MPTKTTESRETEFRVKGISAMVEVREVKGMATRFHFLHVPLGELVVNREQFAALTTLFTGALRLRPKWPEPPKKKEEG